MLFHLLKTCVESCASDTDNNSPLKLQNFEPYVNLYVLEVKVNFDGILNNYTYPLKCAPLTSSM
jgi:hypothetical protein